MLSDENFWNIMYLFYPEISLRIVGTSEFVIACQYFYLLECFVLKSELLLDIMILGETMYRQTEYKKVMVTELAVLPVSWVAITNPDS